MAAIPANLIAANRAFFDSAVGVALGAARKGSEEQAMQWAKLAAECAWVMHPGIYTHPPLEAMLRRVGGALSGGGAGTAPALPQRRGNGRRWLHLLTAAHRIGGHTRFAERLILNAGRGSADRHCVLLIDQGDHEIPASLREAALGTGGDLVLLPERMGLADRARAVRKAAREWADGVLLHVHPSDPVASVAFATSDRPPVVFVNHADHVFWVGTGCSDLVAEIRTEGADLTRARRGDFASQILPIPLELPVQGMPRQEARRMLGVAPDQVVLIAIASSYKFVPHGAHDFPALAAELLRRHENAVLLMVGPLEEDPFFREAARGSQGRLRLFGPLSDVARFYAAADICLESFPFGSLTTTLDAMLLGIPVLRAPKGVPLFFLGDYPGLEGAATGHEEYLQQAGRLVEDASLREGAGDAQREGVLQAHAGAGWLESWDRLVAGLPQPRKEASVPPAGWDRPGELDLIWAGFQQRQGQLQPDAETFYKHRVRALARGRDRGEILRTWFDAACRGDRRIVKILFRNLTQPI